MRRIGRDHGEEGFPLSAAFGHPIAGPIEEDVGAIPARFLEGAAVPESGIVVLIAWGIAATPREGLTDATAAMDQHPVEPALFRQVSVFITQVPFAENPGGVACRAEYFGQGHRIEPKAFPLEDGVGHSIAEFMTTGQQRRAGGRARGADMVLREAEALRVEAVEVRSSQDRVAVARHLPVALIVAHDEDDIGPAAGEALGWARTQVRGPHREQASQESQERQGAGQFQAGAHGLGVLSGLQSR